VKGSFFRVGDYAINLALVQEVRAVETGSSTTFQLTFVSGEKRTFSGDMPEAQALKQWWENAVSSISDPIDAWEEIFINFDKHKQRSSLVESCM